ncbi:cyanuric acid amidohydrolase [Streptomyces endophyticus]|uniref:Cyanuric acid amidohydrolase n=1 Tax=Streptomyces endophyticus TaxID=714166 RepID=A0ABU6F247_9ACTN|nr:ring-opening amidohydrolase [Streptomyces endophyticus]MEB8338081.1 ring-opening amidohydrolase [Streptomyces endophyticus]
MTPAPADTPATVDLLRMPTSGPGDLAPLEALRAFGHSPTDVLAVVGKTEGNGCVNDFSRTLATVRWEPVLPSDTITVFSGGTEGVLSPHVNLIVADPRPRPGHDRGLVAAAGRTRDLAPDEVGREPQLAAVRDVVTELTKRLGLAPEEVDMVLVKCPLLTSDRIAACRATGSEPVTDDTYESMARSRAAAALGVALALGECSEDQALAALADRDTTQVWSSRASASAGAELTDCHVLVLGTSRHASSPLRAVHGTMRDAIDLASLRTLFDRIAAEGGELVQVFAKAEADPYGLVRGQRHTMLTDSDLHSTRHARAAVGGLLSALAGTTALYVSGGAEHQGPPGGGSVTLVYRVPDA